MNFSEAEKKYAELSAGLKNGALTREQFGDRVSKLRLQDEDNTWWQLDQEGRWLTWDGEQWKHSGKTAGSAPTAPPHSATTPAPAGPSSQAPKKQGGVTAFITRTVKRFPLILLVTATIFVIHTYFLVVLNQGFGEGPMGGWVFSRGINFIISPIMWTIVSFFLSSLLLTLFEQGPKGFFTKVTGGFSRTINTLQHGGQSGVGSLLFGMGLALFCTPVNMLVPKVTWFAAIIMALFGLSRPGWMIARFFAKLWHSISNTGEKGKAGPIKDDAYVGQAVMMGLIPGFLISGVFGPVVGLVLGVVFLIAGILLSTTRKPANPTAVASLLLPFAIVLAPYILSLLFPELARADNGGWREAGGTLSTWWGSEGANKALGVSFTESVLTAPIGAAFAVPIETFSTPPGSPGTSGENEPYDDGVDTSESGDHPKVKLDSMITPAGRAAIGAAFGAPIETFSTPTGALGMSGENEPYDDGVDTSESSDHPKVNLDSLLPPEDRRALKEEQEREEQERQNFLSSDLYDEYQRYLKNLKSYEVKWKIKYNKGKWPLRSEEFYIMRGDPQNEEEMGRFIDELTERRENIKRNWLEDEQSENSLESFRQMNYSNSFGPREAAAGVIDKACDIFLNNLSKTPGLEVPNIFITAWKDLAVGMAEGEPAGKIFVKAVTDIGFDLGVDKLDETFKIGEHFRDQLNSDWRELPRKIRKYFPKIPSSDKYNIMNFGAKEGLGAARDWLLGWKEGYK